MPFIINGQKVNKPIYKGVILNAMHVWLQNHWTGTPNASTSTLSQDGQVVATNQVTDPNLVQQMGYWHSKGSITVAQRPDKHWTYTPSSDANLSLWVPIVPLAQDDYVYCEWLGGTGYGTLGNLDTVARGDGWVLGKNTNPAGDKTFWPFLNGTPITMLKLGRYSAVDYAAMQARGIRWFDGTTYTR